MEVTSIGWICGGLILIVIHSCGYSVIVFVGDVEDGVNRAGCIGGPGCLVILIAYLVLAQPENPFIVPVQVPRPQAVSETESDSNAVSRPDYLLSPPASLQLDYNSDDGSGSISWDASPMDANETYALEQD